MMSWTAIVMLACRDYEAMEIALACHAAYLPDGVRLFVLQNCRGCYDSERTLEVARRYATLFPGRIILVDSIEPGPAYRSIAELLASPLLAGHELVCKVDDDAFPIAHRSTVAVCPSRIRRSRRAIAGSSGLRAREPLALTRPFR